MNGNIWAKIEVNVGDVIGLLDGDDKQTVADELVDYASDDALVWELMQRGYNIYRNDNNGERVELTEDNYFDYTDKI